MEGKARGSLSSLLFRSSFENNQYALALSFMSGPADTSSIFFLACSILEANASSKKREDFSKCWATKQHSNSDRRVCLLQHSGLFCCFSLLTVIFCSQATISVGNLRVRLLFYVSIVELISYPMIFTSSLVEVGILSPQWELQWKIRNLLRCGPCFAQRWCLLVWSPHAYADIYSSIGWWGWWDHLPQWPSSPQCWQFPWHWLLSGHPLSKSCFPYLPVVVLPTGLGID